jgi:ethanolamine utilization protein EutM
MEQDSLGLIETLGLVGAIEAADAGSKAANVTFRGYERGRAGLITVVFTGDVAAVRAAVTAGTAAAKQVGQVVSVHVIARPDRQLHLTPDGAKPVEHEIPVTSGIAAPMAGPGAAVSERTDLPIEQPAPATSGRVIEPSPEEIEIARAAAAEHSAVAVVEVEEPVAPSPLGRTAQNQPDQVWTEPKSKGGNGNLPAAETVYTEEAVGAQSALVHKKEKIRKTKARKKN